MPTTDPAITLHINGAEHKLVLEPRRTLLVARRSRDLSPTLRQKIA